MNPRLRILENEIEHANGILRLKPAWVARVFIPPGKRFGLEESQYNLGPRGGICERWLASTTHADNAVSVPDEGLSFLALEKAEPMTLKDAVEIGGPLILGARYARSHPTLDRLAKIFDYADRLPFHVHHMKKHAALVGRKPKEEAYYFPGGVALGPHPESYLGVHPYVAEKKNREILLRYLIEWDTDHILRCSKAYQLLPGDGFHIPAGVLHAPGSPMTIELQEDSDVLAMLQGRVGKSAINKELMFKDVRPQDRKRFGERVILDMVDWKTTGDPYFYEHRHTPPVPVRGKPQAGGEEHWIFYNTRRFSGKRVIVREGGSYTSAEKGVFNILAWRGSGTFAGHPVTGGDPSMDEMLVCHARAVEPIEIRNTGKGDLEIFKFFGPDITPDVPMVVKKLAR